MDRMAGIFIDLCRMDTMQQDGIVFDPDSVHVAKIREEQEYEGVRVVVTATLEKARVSVQVDIGFGDVVTPGSERIVFPVMLDAPAPELNAYPKETVFAEKFHAMVHRGLDNSRMKDFYDLIVMLRIFSWNEAILLEAIRKTFARRETILRQWDLEVKMGMIRTSTMIGPNEKLPGFPEGISVFLNGCNCFSKTADQS